MVIGGFEGEIPSQIYFLSLPTTKVHHYYSISKSYHFIKHYSFDLQAVPPRPPASETYYSAGPMHMANHYKQ